MTRAKAHSAQLIVSGAPPREMLSGSMASRKAGDVADGRENAVTAYCGFHADMSTNASAGTRPIGPLPIQPFRLGPLPVANATDVHVHEVRPGIVTDAAKLQ